MNSFIEPVIWQRINQFGNKRKIFPLKNTNNELSNGISIYIIIRTKKKSCKEVLIDI